jgi:PAS domain S-box-containing protein
LTEPRSPKTPDPAEWSATPILVLSMQGRIEYANLAACRLTGRARDEMVGAHLGDIKPQITEDAWARRLAEVSRTGFLQTAWNLTDPEGGVRPVELTYVLLDRTGDPKILLLGSDRSEIERAERARADREHEARAMCEYLPVPTFVFQKKPVGFVLVDYNEVARKLNGDLEDLRGHTADRVLPGAPSVALDLEHCLLKKSSKRCETEIDPSASGRTRTCVLTYGYVPPDRVIIQLDDVTDQRRVEEQLRLAQRMEAVARLAGGIAHDFNNLITVIGSCAGFALEQRPLDPAVRTELEQIAAAGTRAGALTQQLLSFGRGQVQKTETVRLARVIRGLTDMLGRLIGEDIELSTRVAPDLWSIFADPTRVEQVIMNLVVNARDAMPSGGRLTVEAENVTLADPAVAAENGVAPGAYVGMTVSDTGCGMDADTMARIFEPFFSTKEVGKGTGLGLAMVYGILKQSGGNVTVKSEPGKGASFRVLFARGTAAPRNLSPTPSSTPAVKRSSHPPGAETILVVEDEDALRRVTCRVLEAKGYKVLSTGAPAEALELLERREGSVDLVLTDIVMPAMSGRDLAREIARRRPGVKILYMSGYGEDVIAVHGALDASVHFLAKPFAAADLRRRVREVLDGTPPGG